MKTGVPLTVLRPLDRAPARACRLRSCASCVRMMTGTVVLHAAPLLNHRRDRNSAAPEHRGDRAEHARLIARLEAQIVLAYHAVHRLDTRARERRYRIAERMAARAGAARAMRARSRACRPSRRSPSASGPRLAEIHRGAQRLAVDVDRVECAADAGQKMARRNHRRMHPGLDRAVVVLGDREQLDRVAELARVRDVGLRDTADAFGVDLAAA